MIALPELLELGAMVMRKGLVRLTPAESTTAKDPEKVPAVVGVPRICVPFPFGAGCTKSPGGSPDAVTEYGGVPPVGSAPPLYAFPTVPSESPAFRNKGAGGAVLDVLPWLNHTKRWPLPPS